MSDRIVFAGLLIVVALVTANVIVFPALEWYADLEGALLLAR